MSVQTALIAGTKRLNEAGIEGAPRDARLLMAHVLGIAPGRLTLVLPDAITAEQAQGFEQAIERRAKREPVSHILGYREFFGRRFSVSTDVLDPRPETEVLIAEALSKPFTSVLDLGVGSGAILLTLLAEQVLAKGLGTDVSEAALAVARGNADALGLSSRARFQQADWWDGVEGQFDLITSNPPYIAAEEMAALSPELAHEPRVALTDEADGLSCYRIIAAQVRAFLAPRGRVLVEIGPTQGAAVSALFLEQGLKAVRVLSDFDGRDRVVCAQAPNPHPRNLGK
ncbi:peptide chain release factor N(5)-glutamine methyltransferase [Celeribacter halophilus]|uniref:Release factor glutamine methyltransferase n=1 Tax=Celeribacter halophilus TaxID=576117 RepID=A0A1I3TI94_9RHOB|nr:peptide chain release factor N(5)-glutamine methyltransferase [Celeribacter halophilus]PZX11038.1 release factor glutamine methyltransferase [Celeribacter halophilus]SFJ70615.1 [protein release factor]-glutamine N5-methyltransferase [Celeribacter halophilus]